MAILIRDGNEFCKTCRSHCVLLKMTITLLRATHMGIQDSRLPRHGGWMGTGMARTKMMRMNGDIPCCCFCFGKVRMETIYICVYIYISTLAKSKYN